MQRGFRPPTLVFQIKSEYIPRSPLLELEDMNIFMVRTAYWQIIFLRAYMISLSIVEHTGFMIVLLAFTLITKLWKLLQVSIFFIFRNKSCSHSILILWTN
jgi:hypothetical protein